MSPQTNSNNDVNQMNEKVSNISDEKENKDNIISNSTDWILSGLDLAKHGLLKFRKI